MAEHSKPVRLASAAFRAALAYKTDSALAYVQRISDECGGEGLYVAMMAWIDAYADHATDGQPTRSKARMGYIEADTGQFDRDDSDNLPDEIRWAGQLVIARTTLDRERFDALIKEMPTDAGQIGVYVFSVLEGVTRTINGLPRGFARMGGR
jgi:hypothetical protein